MFLSDENIAWMHKFGITNLRFDSEGNILDVTVLPWVANTKMNSEGVAETEPLLAKPEAPVPPPLKEMTAEEQRIYLNKLKHREMEMTERALYAAVGGSPWDRDDEPRGPQ